MRTNFFPLLLGVSAASAILPWRYSSGQSSTLTATLAGQIVMEGFAAALPPLAAPFDLRLTAIVPALICIIIFGEKYRELACLQPGGLSAVAVCGVSARAVYKQSSADG